MAKGATILRYCIVSVPFFLGCGEAPDPIGDRQVLPETASAPAGEPFAQLQTSQGEILIQLMPEVAPKAVAQFIELAQVGFYNRATFHRVVPGTLIQGGDPLSKDNNPYNDGKGNAGADTFLTAEFSSLPFEPGTVAMARQGGDPDSASCQFFITLRRQEAWDGEYTIFGRVVEGLEVVEAISRVPRSTQEQLEERPAGKQLIQRINIEYRPKLDQPS